MYLIQGAILFFIVSYIGVGVLFNTHKLGMKYLPKITKLVCLTITLGMLGFYCFLGLLPIIKLFI